MANIPSSVKSLSSDNTKDDFIQAARIILKYADNIISNPNDEKFRKIRLGNPTVESKLLPVVGALECFFDMGFIEVNYIFLPSSTAASTSLVTNFSFCPPNSMRDYLDCVNCNANYFHSTLQTVYPLLATEP